LREGQGRNFEAKSNKSEFQPFPPPAHWPAEQQQQQQQPRAKTAIRWPGQKPMTALGGLGQLITSTRRRPFDCCQFDWFAGWPVSPFPSLASFTSLSSPVLPLVVAASAASPSSSGVSFSAFPLTRPLLRPGWKPDAEFNMRNSGQVFPFLSLSSFFSRRLERNLSRLLSRGTTY